MKMKIITGWAATTAIVLGFAIYFFSSGNQAVVEAEGAVRETETLKVLPVQGAEIQRPLMSDGNSEAVEQSHAPPRSNSLYARSPNRKLIESPSGESSKRLVKSLRLSTETAEKLLDILADELQRTQQWLIVNHRSFLSEEEGKELRAESDALVQNLLGENKFQQYDDYRGHRLERGIIDRFSERLDDTNGEGSYPEVDEYLYAAIKEEISRTPSPRLRDYASYTEFQVASKKWREDSMKRFVDRAAKILLPDQLEFLKRIAK